MNDLLRRMLFLPTQASKLAHDVDQLHYFVILTTLAVSTVLGILAVWFMIRYRRRRPNQPTPHIESPVWMEVIFVGFPLAIFLLWFRIGFGQFIDLTSPPKDAMDVYVTGKKWMWKFAYPEGPNGLAVLKVPQGRPVRLLLTSRDVIHSFYMPAFRVKEDALPGRYTQTWFQAEKLGRYPVFCAEYCGTGHSTMRAEIEVVPAEEFDAWVDQERRGKIEKRDTPNEKSSDLVAWGESLAVKHGCVKCHSVDGSPHIGPSWLDMYGRKETMQDGEVITIDEAYITQSMMAPKLKQVHGYELSMPSFLGELSGPESAAIVEYIKSLRTSEVEPPAQAPTFQEVKK